MPGLGQVNDFAVPPSSRSQASIRGNQRLAQGRGEGHVHRLVEGDLVPQPPGCGTQPTNHRMANIDQRLCLAEPCNRDIGIQFAAQHDPSQHTPNLGIDQMGA